MAVAELREVLRAGVAEHGHRALLEIAGLVRVARRLFVLGPQVRGRGREDLETLGCAVDAGREGQALRPGLERAPVALVRDDRVGAAELLAVPNPVPANAQCSGRCTV